MVPHHRALPPGRQLEAVEAARPAAGCVPPPPLLLLVGVVVVLLLLRQPPRAHPRSLPLPAPRGPPPPLRAGEHTGHVSLTPEGHLQLAVEWGEPLGGSGRDVFVVSEGGARLEVTTTLAVGGEEVGYMQVYCRER